MSDRKRRRLDQAVAALQQRYGPQVLRRGAPLADASLPPHISSGFAALDAITGCAGIPLGAVTLLSGRSTSGKLTLAYKTLAAAQRRANSQTAASLVALMDLSHQSDPDYLTRCGIDLAQLVVVRPAAAPAAVDLLMDLARSCELRLILVDGLADLAADRPAARALSSRLSALAQQLHRSGAGLILIDELQAPWQRWVAARSGADLGGRVRQTAALEIEIRRERWLRQGGSLVGYRAQAHVRRSRWQAVPLGAAIEIRFNGTVRAQPTW